MADPTSDRALCDSLTQFVYLKTRSRKVLSESTDLAKDLGLDGGDASDFILEFQREFNVDLSHFRFDRYFGGEGFRLIEAVKSAVGAGMKRKPLTIFILLTAAENGSWLEMDPHEERRKLR